MVTIGLFLLTVCRLYTLILIARVVLDFIQIFSRTWRPTGLLLPVAVFVYKVTDPPLRLLARYIPPLRLGGVSLDIGFIVLYFAVQLLEILIRMFFLR